MLTKDKEKVKSTGKFIIYHKLLSKNTILLNCDEKLLKSNY